MLKRIYSILSCLLLLSSCQKNGFENQSSNTQIVVDGDLALAEKYKALFDNIHTGVSINLQSDMKAYSFSARFPKGFDGESIQIQPNNMLRSNMALKKSILDDAVVFSSQDNQLAALYGQEVGFNIQKSPSSINEKLYIPKPLNAQLVFYDNQTYVAKTKGAIIEWEIDRNPQNDKGVLIELFYDATFNKALPGLQENLPTKSIKKYIVVPDNGRYELSLKDFKELPVCPQIIMNVYRGNFKTVMRDSHNTLNYLAYDHYYNAFTLKE